MKKMYGYIRVSTAKQGEGVSLEEQKLAIIRYARDHELQIVDWFEETSSASKGRRRAFYDMLKKLKRKLADGVVIHKIDRGSRNISDWSEISRLSDQGVDVRFAHDNVDLKSRSSRLLADMQAVIAIDYSRNLSEEARKGQNGRLRQGLYPFRAPIGYLDSGRGVVKKVDFTKATLVVKLFELYATGEYSQERLRDKMNALGLTNTRGNPLCKNNIFRTLRNPFYIGVIKVLTTGKTYQGQHKPLITSALFEQVQARLSYKANPKPRKHQHVYQKQVVCDLCGYTMTGGMYRGVCYYRCHQKGCDTKTIREDVLTRAITEKLKFLVLPEEFQEWIFNRLDHLNQASNQEKKSLKQSSKLAQGNLEAKLNKLTDHLLDGVISQKVFAAKQEELNLQLRREQEKIARLEADQSDLSAYLKKIFKTCFSPKVRHFEQLGAKKRDIVKLMTSRVSVSGKKPLIELKTPFELLRKAITGHDCWDTKEKFQEMSGDSTPQGETSVNKEFVDELIVTLTKEHVNRGDAIQSP